MYLVELSIVLITVLGGIVTILIKKAKSNGNGGNGAVVNNELKHIIQDIDDLKKDISNLYSGENKIHLEFDRIINLIHELELKIVKLGGGGVK